MEKAILKCAIIDDESLAITVIKDYIEQIPQLEFVASLSDPLEVMQMFNKHKIDLLFLDIEMPKMTGIELLKSIKIDAQVILTTAYREYALESYDLEVVDYLLKPISFARFVKAVNKVLINTSVSQVERVTQKANSSSGGSIYVYSDKKNVKLYFDEILYIESLKDYIRIHTQSKNIITKETITKYAELLPPSFLRIHRSFIVNTEKITAFTRQDVEIGEKELPIGKSYKSQVIKNLKR